MRNTGRPLILLFVAAMVLASARTGHTAPANTTPKPLAFVSVSAGGTHTCAVTAEGLALCWGSNYAGTLGNDSTTEQCDYGRPCSTSPVPVLGGLTFRSVNVGWDHTCGLTTSGAAYCWGSNAIGQLGNGFSRTSSTKPATVVGALTFKEVSAGQGYTCGITTQGTAYCWGENVFGRLGNGMRSLGPSSSPTSSPVLVSGGLTFKSVSTGQKHACGLTTEGQAYCWGHNGFGALGSGSLDNESHTSPVPVSGGFTFQSVSAGTDHTCAVTANGVAYCWGSNPLGQLGNGLATLRYEKAPRGTLLDPILGAMGMHEAEYPIFVPPSPSPVPVLGGLAFRSLSAGSAHTCGVTASGAVYCWGSNAVGTLGVPSTPVSSKPVPISGGLAFQSVSAGTAHTCGVTTGGAVYCWGDNRFGRLGTTSPMESCGFGSRTSPCSTTPIRISDPR